MSLILRNYWSLHDIVKFLVYPYHFLFRKFVSEFFIIKSIYFTIQSMLFGENSYHFFSRYSLYHRSVQISCEF